MISDGSYFKKYLHQFNWCDLIVDAASQSSHGRFLVYVLSIWDRFFYMRFSAAVLQVFLRPTSFGWMELNLLYTLLSPLLTRVMFGPWHSTQRCKRLDITCVSVTVRLDLLPIYSRFVRKGAVVIKSYQRSLHILPSNLCMFFFSVPLSKFYYERRKASSFLRIFFACN
jgi:hypothetical protein